MKNIICREWSTKIGVKSKWEASLFIDVKVALGFELNRYVAFGFELNRYDTCWVLNSNRFESVNNSNRYQ